MTQCLSDEALTRALAGLASDAERAHLAVCAACLARRQHADADLAQITLTLATTPEPAARRARAPRRWMAIAAASAVAAVALLWIEVTAWRVVHRLPDTAQAEEMAALADVSTTLFSVDGEPARARDVDAMPTLQLDDDDEALDQDPVDAGGPS
jgi:hypothetical protein